MPGFNAVAGQESASEILQTFLSTQSIPHAMLFTGLPGVGKRTTARRFAMALNCERAGDAGAVAETKPAARDRMPGIPCGQCRTCRQIETGSHPDFILIEPRGATLRVNQIRGLLGTLAMKPYSANHRVAVIADAQAMNAEAGNALLKVLEEPPDNTILIVTAIQKSDLLPTLVSRCRHIRFSPLGQQYLTALLETATGIDREQALAAAVLAGGSFSKALRLIEMQWKDQRHWIIRAAGLDGKTAGRPPGAATLSAVSLGAALAFAGKLAAHKDSIQEFLDLLLIWIRDLLVVGRAPAQVANSDCVAMLRAARARLDEPRLLQIGQAVEKAQKDIAANANLRLTLDVMALRIAMLSI